MPKRSLILTASLIGLRCTAVTSFGIAPPTGWIGFIQKNNDGHRIGMNLCMSANDGKVTRLDPDPREDPLAFIDLDGPGEPRWIDVIGDYQIELRGAEYTVGVPCDYSVAICYFDSSDQLVPVDIDSEVMDNIFPICNDIIAEEFGNELVLARTPQTLTLVGELEEDAEEDSEEVYDEFLDANDLPDDDEEDVEMLLAFEVDGVEYNLVKLLDPVLLVAKKDEENRYLILDEEESAEILPVLEELFVEFEEIESAREENHAT
mmetsp:Transcript_16599/g.21603  ORF Transcript_16599/g.21603 Transcript_16599/m.21603 type:complete len:262 (-) Transcript_16599:263-1048(-)|eukprot:CAMPEP_0116063474 /NCGR_PEP_ID=MMETSP0322-20121206/8445_1 /TAXON_ID=163516 /ORGANISM="Leptocylindrus danicus var. apora, Strain B651" /LENGTH=261 /DNA_ID=CAMNT_0003549117 /DNA_START=80 /DNA_END=865 /DNA_ORIENTATION=+